MTSGSGPNDSLWGDGHSGRPEVPRAAPALPSSPPAAVYAPRQAERSPGAVVVPPGPELVLAGWWRRALAATIDTLIIALIAFGVVVALGIGFFSADSEAETLAVGALSLLALGVLIVVTLLYAPVLLWLTDGRTVGRMVAGTRVVRANGRPMSLGVAIVREVVLKAMVFGLLSQATFGLAGLIDVLWPLADRENRALHDFGVDTRTVLR